MTKQPKALKAREPAATSHDQVVTTTSRAIELANCYVAPENPRFGKEPADVDALADNIAACQMLMPLQGYLDENDRFAITNGARRFAALTKLADTGRRDRRLPIDVRFIRQEEAAQAALAIDTHNKPLTPVEAARTWSAMTKGGRDVAEIARAFGVTERFVLQRLKLASLHEPILDALDKGEISLDAAQIYAGANADRQARIWKKLGKEDRGDPREIRDEIADKTMRAGDPVARFVGEEAYAAAGGQVEQDFFVEADDRRWLNPDLAHKLAKQKLEAAAKELKGEGFKFVEAAPEEGDLQHAYDDAKAETRTPTKEEAARKKAITGEIKTLRGKINDIYDEDLPWEQQEAKQEPFEKQIEALEAEETRIDESLRVVDDKTRAKSGAVITIGADGALAIRRGVVERKASTLGYGASSRPKPAKRDPDAPKKKAPPMTNGAHEQLTAIGSATVARALAQNADVAFIALTACLARELFGGGDDQAIDLQATSKNDWSRRREEKPPGLTSDKAWLAQYGAWAGKLGKPDHDYETKLAEWSDTDRRALFAFCVASFVHVREFNSAAKPDKGDARHKLAAIGAMLKADPSEHWTPDAEFMGKLSRPTLEAAAAEMGVDSAGAKTKGALAALLADKAKAARWTPPLLRTLCGVEVKPSKPAKVAKPPAKAPKKAAPKKALKKIAKQPAKKIARKQKGNGADHQAHA